MQPYEYETEDGVKEHTGYSSKAGGLKPLTYISLAPFHFLVLFRDAQNPDQRISHVKTTLDLSVAMRHHVFSFERLVEFQQRQDLL